MTDILSRCVARGFPAAEILTIAALIIVGLHLTQVFVRPVAHPSMHTVDQPRCFPEGTLGTEGFAGCPDSRPALVRT